MLKELLVGKLYSNDEIFKTLKVANAGGIRLSIQNKTVFKAVIMTSVQEFNRLGENPYHDRLEGDVLTYTAAGKTGEQTLAGINNRIIEQKKFNFPIHGFSIVADRRDKAVGPKRWKYMGLLEYLRHYSDTQIDSGGKVRKVWLFEFKIHKKPSKIPVNIDVNISRKILLESRKNYKNDLDDIVDVEKKDLIKDLEQIEKVRSRLLGMEPRKFEFFIKDLLVHTGFTNVCVTQYSSDGGVDVNAVASGKMWIYEGGFVQIQAKRWLHSVGRKEVAELRGSLQSFAKGVVITTSHFSKSAINESNQEGKNPISLIDGFRLSRVVLDEKFKF